MLKISLHILIFEMRDKGLEARLKLCHEYCQRERERERERERDWIEEETVS